MARLVYFYRHLRRAREQELQIRRNERRIMRNADKAFSMPEEEFFHYYRVTKELFEEIYDELSPYMPAHKRTSEISPKYKLLIALSYFATGSYQRLVGGTYGTLMSQQSVSRSIRDVVEALNTSQIREKWIKFPQTLTESNLIKRRFFEKFNMPAVLGCIDGTHVAIIRPHDNEERFFNRKHYHSRNVQIICDADLNILSVDASFGGATHDSFIWNQHIIRRHIIQLINQGENVYFLGDSGYAQREYMMTPIVDAAQGSPEENYTRLHCTARNTVERTIGVLKNRWRCLLGHRVLHYHLSIAAKIIIACCVLHNICNKKRLPQDDIPNIPEADLDVNAAIVMQDGNAADLQRGLEKRRQLVQQLWAARNRQ